VAILLGVLLLLCSTVGLYVQSTVAKPEEGVAWQPDDQGNSPARRSRGFALPPNQTALPTWTPFQPQNAAPAPSWTPMVATSTPEAGFLVPVEPQPTPTPPALPLPPERLIIPAINLDTWIEPAGYQLVDFGGQVFQQWTAPTHFAAGWQTSSAFLGTPGNTVLNGHHNIYGSVFGGLVYLKEGDEIEVYSGSTIFVYKVTNKMILPEEGQDLAVRLDNASWLQASDDERLTLVTCWPEWTNTHRLIVVAVPVTRFDTGGG
jgi:LPXTG-site transpeptidase (sortase) family protein